MSTSMLPPDRRSWVIISALLFASFMLGCAGKNANAPPSGTAPDSARVADSSAEVVMVAPAFSYEERQGMALYAHYCAVCHGSEGKGDGFNAFNLDPRPRDFTDSVYMSALSDAQIAQTISGGGRSVNKSPLMPSYGWTLTKLQREYLVFCLRRFSPRK